MRWMKQRMTYTHQKQSVQQEETTEGSNKRKARNTDMLQ